MFERILKAELTFPSHIKPDARHLLAALLTRDPDKRLGSGPGDAWDIRNHPFFAPLDWNKVSDHLIY
jgi:serine/threonine protein kinase